MEESEKRYMTIREATAKWGIYPNRLSELCRQGRVEGAVQDQKGALWKIPVDAPRPLLRKQSKQTKK